MLYSFITIYFYCSGSVSITISYLLENGRGPTLFTELLSLSVLVACWPVCDHQRCTNTGCYINLLYKHNFSCRFNIFSNKCDGASHRCHTLPLKHTSGCHSHQVLNSTGRFSTPQLLQQYGHMSSTRWQSEVIVVMYFRSTCFSTTSGSMSGTRRMENLPLTLRGITVLAPASEKAPSIPWRDRDGYLQRCIRICSYKKKK